MTICCLSFFLCDLNLNLGFLLLLQDLVCLHNPCLFREKKENSLCNWQGFRCQGAESFGLSHQIRTSVVSYYKNCFGFFLLFPSFQVFQVGIKKNFSQLQKKLTFAFHLPSSMNSNEQQPTHWQLTCNDHHINNSQ